VNFSIKSSSPRRPLRPAKTEHVLAVGGSANPAKGKPMTTALLNPSSEILAEFAADAESVLRQHQAKTIVPPASLVAEAEAIMEDIAEPDVAARQRAIVAGLKVRHPAVEDKIAVNAAFFAIAAEIGLVSPAS
jgi:hypothetical protein